MNIGGMNATLPIKKNGLTGIKQSFNKKKLMSDVTTASLNTGTFNLKVGGVSSRALSDGSNVTVYKADSYTKENPLLRIVTTSPDGKESEQMIDPRKVDVTNATENEMFALNSFLVDDGKLDNDVYKTGMFTDSSVSDTRKNFADIVKDLMDIQYNANNLSGYAKYNKILNTYNLLEKSM